MFQPNISQTGLRKQGVALPVIGALLFATAITSPSSFVYAQAGVVNAAEREVARRQQLSREAEAAISRGDFAMQGKDYATAVEEYQFAVMNLPDSVAAGSRRSVAVDKFSNASVQYAQFLITQGRRTDAEIVLKRVISPEINPGFRPALQVLANMENPGYYNPTITPRFVEKVEKVKQLLMEAEGFYDTGRFDMAYERYERVLNVDPYNIAARKGMEKVNFERSKYAAAAYNTTRSELIWKVDKGWEIPPRRFDLETREGLTGMVDRKATDTTVIKNKLDSIIIPSLDLRQSTIREAITFLQSESRRLDTGEPDPARKGVNIVLRLSPPSGAANLAPGAAATDPNAVADPFGNTAATGASAAPFGAAGGAGGDPSDTRITLALSNVPLSEALRYVTDLANLKYKVDQFAVAVVPLSENTEDLITREYRVPPSFFPNAAAASGGAEAGGGGGGFGAFGGGSGSGAPNISVAKKISALDYFKNSGVPFPEGATAQYLPSSSRLVVRNTQTNMELIESLITDDGAVKQVDIEAKFIEVSQNNLKELGFDWLLGQFNVGNQQVFAGGGTIGNQGENRDFTFVDPGTGLPTGISQSGSGITTAGNRSGSYAIGADSIASLITTGVAGGALGPAAPAIFGLAGVFTDPQFQVVIRALNQSKAIDLMSAPRVVARSGQEAKIEVIREFIYPTEFDPPQIPDTFGGTDNGGGGGVSVVGQPLPQSFPVTPATPTAFDKRDTGVTLRVTPTVGADNYTIDMNLIPEVVEFEGFINYGSPIGIATPTVNLLGITTGFTNTVLTPNTINQPIFSTRRVTTSVSIWDGATVTLGGLMREDVQKVEDKVPFMGDLPLVGRLFRSEAESHIKRNLVIFVTARLIDPSGQPLNLDVEEEEIIEPLVGPDTFLPPPSPSAPLFMK